MTRGHVLTDQQRAVLTLIAEGLPDKKIAQVLEIRERTVRFHVARILSKLAAQSRAHAVAVAYESGEIERPASATGTNGAADQMPEFHPAPTTIGR